MNAPPFPTNPSFGQYYGNWVWSGSRWVCTNTNGVRIVVQTFRASAPYTPSPGLISAMVETWGGGGGGGTVQTTIATEVVAAGGGGSGGYSRIALASGLVLGGVNVTIGAGGGGANYNPAGDPGQATSFGALCVANGGQGGQTNNLSTSWGGGGAGGAPGIGDVAMPGSAGHPGLIGGGGTVTAIGGAGGVMWGGNTPSAVLGPGSIAGGQPVAANTGAGGGGAVANQIIGAQGGADGASGLCVVTEYCWADAVDDGCGCGPTGGARVAITGPQGWQGGFDND
jgi:hypothetical protein